MKKPLEFKEGEALLFVNKKREKDSDPNAKGIGKLNGQLISINAWTNTAVSGEKYQKLSFKELNQEQQQEQSRGSYMRGNRSNSFGE